MGRKMKVNEATSILYPDLVGFSKRWSCVASIAAAS
jgi:hypothetical protein